ncbi:DnaA regulatory inactivator Hda [Litorilituus sediminis]|uniref:DnaA regulatory inactivator Hda n=1 Tax=Litorilituus sediminis TaxID=718192 RepID=A0A4P6P169_9GAMM|nr:DnaA regulatory inactivator Hda [Litorilituus sediminis]QBG34811.1 DnaA regulatory inactivator Hda [Litorilituus sediminis]
MQASQLGLSVQLPDDETFDSFRSEANSVVTGQLQDFVRQDQLQLVDNTEEESLALFGELPHSFFLFGLAGVGKSHLLHASSNFAAQLGKSSVCLSCAELKHLPVEVLDGLEQMDLICLDDIGLIAGDEKWQQAIFDLFNRVLEQNNYLIITGDETAHQLGITLPDLVSRLSWGYTEQIKPLCDDEKVLALQYRAGQRGLLLSDEAVRFLLNRASRDMSSLLKALDTLDKASIRAQRRITIPFIKQVLNIN